MISSLFSFSVKASILRCSGQKRSYVLYFIFSEAGVPSHTKLLHLSVDYAK